MKRNRFKKIIASFLAIILTLGIVIPTVSEVTEAASPQIKRHGTIDLPGASSVVGKFTIDGVQAFCMQHTKLAPDDNSYGSANPYDNEDVKKTLYYGWAGPEQWSGFKAKDKYGWSQKEHGIALTSLLLSCYYDGDSPSLYSYIDGFDDFRKYVASKPNIRTKIGFSKNKLTGKWDTKLKLQKTETVTVTGEKGANTSFTLPTGITLVHTNGKKDTGKVTVKKGDEFYLTADAARTDTYKTGNVGKNFTFQPMRFKAHASGPQDVGYARLYKDPATKVSLTVKWSALGKAQITKVSESGKAIKGAKFNIKKTDGSYEKNVTTNEKGVVLVDSLVAGEYKVTETYVPKPYLLDKTPKTVTVKPNDTAAVAFTNNLPTGKIIIVKSDKYNNLLKGAVYRISSIGNDPEGVPINYSKDFTTDGNGNITVTGLKLGKYKIEEIQAPDGYLVNKTAKTVTLSYENNTTIEVSNSNSFENAEPTGKVSLKKVFTNNTLIGDAKLEGATYELRAKEDITNKAGTKKFYSAGDLVATRVADKEGKMEDITNLPLGKYILKETVASEGCLIDKKEYEVELLYKDQNTAIISKAVTSKEQIKKLGVHIFKASIKEVNGVIPGLEGAEFTIKLQSDILKAKEAGFTYEEIWNGIDSEGNKVDVDEARVLDAQKIAPTYAVLTTDKDGEAYTTANISYGKYVGKETKTPKDYYTAEDFVFTLDKDVSEVAVAHKYKNIYINNEQMESQVKLVKKDLNSGKLVSLTSATFKVKAEKDIVDRATGKLIYAKGEYIKQKVAGKWYDEFTTNSKGMVGTFAGPLGTILVPLKLPVGTYSVDEIKLPDGFLELENPVIFNIENIRDFGKDEDGDYITTVEIKNEQPKGELELTKKIQKNDNADLTINKNDFTKIKFALYAEEDIIDMADGEVIYKANEKINEYNLDAHGKLYLKNLWIGKYYLKETQTLDGLVLDETKYDVTFTKTDNTSKVISVAKEVTNYATQTSITKEDNNNKLVSGAEFKLSDSKGNVIHKWKTTDKPFVIEGLKVGETYTLDELTAPEGFVLAKPVKFTVQNTKELQKYKLVDKQVEFVKTDVDGNVISGMEYTVTNNKSKEIVDKGVTSAKGRNFLNGLKIGETYTITETKVPEGFVHAKPIEFTVTEDNKLQTVTMKDKQVIVEKTTEKGEPVIGAELKVVDKDNKVVDSWTVEESKAHAVKGLVEGSEYTLIEDYAPETFVLAKPIKFTVTEKKENQTINMIDKQVEFVKTDVDGNVISGMEYTVTNNKSKEIVDKGVTNAKGRNFLNGLKIGETYTITETKVPEGFVHAKPIEFTVTEDSKLQTVTMKDKQVTVKKTDIGGENVVGAKLQVIDKETGKVVDSWTVKEGEPEHIVKGLVEGKEYTLAEEYAPNGFVISNKVDFTITEEKVNQTVEMIDKKVQFKKLGKDNKILTGGKFEIKDKETGKVVDIVTAEKDFIDIDHLVEGKIYIIHEKEAPYGYKVGKDVEFRVSYDKKTQKLVMKDTPKEGRIIVTDDNGFGGDEWYEVETGDHFGLVLLIMLLIASGLGTLIFAVDRTRKNRK